MKKLLLITALFGGILAMNAQMNATNTALSFKGENGNTRWTIGKHSNGSNDNFRITQNNPNKDIFTINDLTHNIGIGITTPQSNLHIKGESGIYITGGLAGGTHGKIKVYDSGSGSAAEDDMYFGVNGGFVFQMDENGISNPNIGTGIASGFAVQNRHQEEVFTIRENTGNVGIGTTSPTQKLDVNGTIKFSDKLFIATNKGTLWNTIIENYTELQASSQSEGLSLKTTWARPIIFSTNGIEKMQLDAAGNLLIGTTGAGVDPNAKLAVNGLIHAKEVLVDLAIAPDYVFQKYYTGKSTLKADYTMLTLEEVEAFTKANHHLPEVPSAATIKEDGLQLKEMTTLLLQKVEELTLYTIEQEKRIKTLEAKLVEKN